MRVRTVPAVVLAGALLALLAAAPAALANSTRSTNWAGYAVHRAGVSFSQVSGTWVEPGANCTAGRRSYSAVWLGLGGYDLGSGALEQIGTEIDCNATGHVVSTAWYELVPKPSRTISLAVAPGDLMHAAVSVNGDHVRVELDNLTQHRRFVRTFTTQMLDVSSAEWIVEAPSECVNQFACQALPLADFGSVRFDSAQVTTSAGLTGPIANHHWGRTKITLTPDSGRFIVARNSTETAGRASPSSLRGRGSSFAVTYAASPAAANPSAPARGSRLRASYLVH